MNLDTGVGKYLATRGALVLVMGRFYDSLRVRTDVRQQVKIYEFRT